MLNKVNDDSSINNVKRERRGGVNDMIIEGEMPTAKTQPWPSDASLVSTGSLSLLSSFTSPSLLRFRCKYRRDTAIWEKRKKGEVAKEDVYRRKKRKTCLYIYLYHV